MQHYIDNFTCFTQKTYYKMNHLQHFCSLHIRLIFFMMYILSIFTAECYTLRSVVGGETGILNGTSHWRISLESQPYREPGWSSKSNRSEVPLKRFHDPNIVVFSPQPHKMKVLLSVCLLASSGWFIYWWFIIDI